MGKRAESNKPHTLMGTFISVLFIGVFIIGSWVSVYYLFLQRM